MSDAKIANPYGAAAMQYLPEWSPLPVATRGGEKVLLVKGVSGGHEKYADAADVREWIGQPWLSSSGVALRVPKNVIGIDLDCYGDKAGRRTFAALQGKWGRLEPTWVTTARSDGSGIRLYRIPEAAIPLVDNMRDPKGCFDNGDPLGGMEIIRWRHRYATVWPTWHGGVDAMYQWYDPERQCSDEIPLPEDLAYLPDGWITGLATAPEGYLKAGSTELTGKPSEWLRTRPGGDGPLCVSMERDLKRYTEEVTAGGRSGGCYPAASRGLLALVGNAAEGHRGGLKAVTGLWEAYREAMNGRSEGRRGGDAVEREFANSLSGAIRGLPARKFRDYDPCEMGL